MIVPSRATLEDLYRVEGPAELIAGRIVPDMTGERPGDIAENIFLDLAPFVRRLGKGKAHADGVGYVVPPLPSERESFCPDVSYHTRPRAQDPMRFIAGAPDFAVEVRSENDYGPAAEQALAEKRKDYFLAGTQIVWDVDPKADTVTVYRADAPDIGQSSRKGQSVDAEPVIPGWRMSVDEIFR